MCLFAHAGRALRLAKNTFRSLFSFTKGADKPIFPGGFGCFQASLQCAMQLNAEVKKLIASANFSKNAMPLTCLSGNFAAFLSAKAACILRTRTAADASLSGRTAQIAQLHSAESSVNSAEKPAGFYEELTQKQSQNSQKRVLFSSKPTIFFVRVSLQLISKNRGLPRQNRRTIYDFSSKKRPQLCRRKHLKNLKVRVSSLSFIGKKQEQKLRITAIAASLLRQLSACFRLTKRISIGLIANGRFQIGSSVSCRKLFLYRELWYDKE